MPCQAFNPVRVAYVQPLLKAEASVGIFPEFSLQLAIVDWKCK